MAEKQTYMFKRNHPDGRTSTLVGAEVQALSADDAMNQLKVWMGYTAKQGWYAEVGTMFTDNVVLPVS